MVDNIQKKIRLNSITSHIPGILPSYKSAYDEYNVSYKEYGTVYDEKNGNYGLIPTDFQIPQSFIEKITDKTDIWINIKTPLNSSERDFYGEFYLIEALSHRQFNKLLSYAKRTLKTIAYIFIYENDLWKCSIDSDTEYSDIFKKKIRIKFLTYSTAHKWYRFFKEYNKMLTVTGSETYNYNSLQEYSKTSLNDLASYDYYVEMDKLYEARGGYDFFKWLNDYVFSYYKVYGSKEENGKINTITGKDVPSYMYFPQRKEWLGWFKKNSYFSGKTCSEILSEKNSISALSSMTDSKVICQYNEWTDRGGDKMFEWLLNNVKEYNIDGALNTSAIHIPIEITNTISNLGEETELGEYWEGGKEYKKGNVFFYEDTCYKVTMDSIPSKYNDCSNTFEFDKKYCENNLLSTSGDYAINYSKYSYNTNNEYIINPTRFRMADTYQIVSGAFFYINGIIYSAIASNYITVQTGSQKKELTIKYESNDVLTSETSSYITKFYPVFFYSDGRSYCDVNGERFIGNKKEILFRENINCDAVKYTISDSKEYFIFYDGRYVMASSNPIKITIQDDYYAYNSYFNGSKGIGLLSGDTNISLSGDYSNYVWIDESGMNLSNQLLYPSFYVDKNSMKAFIVEPYDVYDISQVSGTIESRLDNFLPNDYVVDNMGNMIGTFFENQKNTFPNSGEIIGKRFKEHYITNIDKETEAYMFESKRYNYLFGDILENITYYYEDSSGNTGICNDKEIKIMNDSSSWNISGYSFSANFEYVTGCVIKLFKDDKTSSIFYSWIGDIPSESGNANFKKGIIYNEIRKLKLVEKLYVLNNLNSYPVYFIDTIANTNFFYRSDNYEPYSANMATFKYYRDFDEIDGIRYANLDESLFNASPTVRINYNLKVSIPKKIKTDIYIDRGNGTSFSRHFALGECKSLEALTQYQDGGLKIINNNDVNTL